MVKKILSDGQTWCWGHASEREKDEAAERFFQKTEREAMAFEREHGPQSMEL